MSVLNSLVSINNETLHISFIFSRHFFHFFGPIYISVGEKCFFENRLFFFKSRIGDPNVTPKIFITVAANHFFILKKTFFRRPVYQIYFWSEQT